MLGKWQKVSWRLGQYVYHVQKRRLATPADGKAYKDLVVGVAKEILEGKVEPYSNIV